jgi:hypothetical protein
MPFILNEDKALKLMLTGVTVSDSGNSARPVGVWFGQPDLEIRAQSYPYMTIDFLGYNEDFERSHRGEIQMPYFPEGANTTQQYMTEFPIPVYLDYQITTWARQPRHDRQIMAEMATGQRIPLRYGLLIVPEDKTVRRLDFLGFTKKDTTDENGKRLFSNAYTVRISAEILPVVLEQMIEVTETNVQLTSQSNDFATIYSPS